MDTYSQKTREFKINENKPEILLTYVCQLLNEVQLLYYGDSSFLDHLLSDFSAYLYREAKNDTFVVQRIRSKIWTFFLKFSFKILKAETVASLVKIASSCLAVEDAENGILCVKIVSRAFKHKALPAAVFDSFVDFFLTLFNKLSEIKISFFATDSLQNTKVKSKDSVKTLYHALKAAHKIIAGHLPHFKRKTGNLNKLIISVSMLKVKPAVLEGQKNELTFFFLTKVHALALFQTLNSDPSDAQAPAFQIGSIFSETIALAEAVPASSFRVVAELLGVLEAFAEVCPTSIAFKKVFEAKVLKRLTYLASPHTQRRSLALVAACLRNLRNELPLSVLQRVFLAAAKTVQAFGNVGVHAAALELVAETVGVLEEQSEAFEIQKDFAYAELLLSKAVAMAQYMEAIAISFETDEIANMTSEVNKKWTVRNFVTSFKAPAADADRDEYELAASNLTFRRRKSSLPFGREGDLDDMAKTCEDLFGLFRSALGISERVFALLWQSIKKRNCESISFIDEKRFWFFISRRAFDAQREFLGLFVRISPFFEPSVFHETFGLSTLAAKDFKTVCSAVTSMSLRYFRGFSNKMVPVLFQKLYSGGNLANGMAFVAEFLNSTQYSKYFSDSLLMFLKHEIRSFAEKSELGLKADIVFSTLKRVFDLAQNNSQLNEVFNCYTQNLVKKCVTSITFGVGMSIVYIHILNKLFEFIPDSEESFSQVMLIMPNYYQQLSQLISAAGTEPQSALAAKELSIHIPNKFCHSSHFIRQIIHNIVECLDSDKDRLILLAFQKIKTCDVDYFFQFFDSSLDQRLESAFVRAVCALVGSKNDKISKKAIKILARLGGKNRRFIGREFRLKKHKNYSDLSVSIERGLENFPFSRIYLKCCKTLANSDNPVAVERAFSIVRLCVSSFYDFKISPEEPAHEYTLNFSLGKDGKKITREDYNHYYTNKLKIKRHERFLGKGLKAIIASLKFPTLYQKKQIYIHNIAHYSAIQCLCEKSLHSVDPKVFLRALLSVMALPDNLGTSEGVKILIKFVEAISAIAFLNIDGAHSETGAPAIFEFLRCELSHQCSKRSRSMRKSGLLGLFVIYESLPQKWKYEHGLFSAKAVFKALEGPGIYNHNLYEEAHSYLRIVANDIFTDKRVIGEESHAKMMIKNSLENRLLAIIASECASKGALNRACAGSLLKLVKELTGVTETKILAHYNMTSHLLSMAPSEIKNIPFEDFGSQLAFTNYCLSLNPPFVASTSTEITLVTEAIEEIIKNHGDILKKLDTELNVHFRCRFVKTNQKLQIYGLGFLASAIEFKKKYPMGLTESSHMTKLKTKLIVAIMKFLERKSIFIGQKTKNLLRTHLGVHIDGITSKLDFLENHLQPIMINLMDNNTFNFNFAKSASKIIGLLQEGKFKSGLGGRLIKLLDNLNSVYFNGSRLTREQILFPLYIFDFLVLYPPYNQNEMSIEKFIMFMMKFQSNLPDIYGHCVKCIGHNSPFFEKFVSYCQKYPEVTVNFFMNPNTILEPKYYELFIDVLEEKGSTEIKHYVKESLFQSMTGMKSTKGPIRFRLEKMMVRIMWYALQDHTDTLNNGTTEFLTSFLENYQALYRHKKIFEIDEWVQLATKMLLFHYSDVFSNIGMLSLATRSFGDWFASNHIVLLAFFREVLPKLDMNAASTAFSAFTHMSRTRSVGERLALLSSVIRPLFSQTLCPPVSDGIIHIFSEFLRSILDKSANEPECILVEIIRIATIAVGRIPQLNLARDILLKLGLLNQISHSAGVSIEASLLVSKLIVTFNANDQLLFDFFNNLISFSPEDEAFLVLKAFRRTLSIFAKNNSINKLVMVIEDIFLRRTASKASKKLILAIIVDNHKVFTAYRSTVCETTLNFLIKHKDELGETILFFYEKMTVMPQTPEMVPFSVKEHIKVKIVSFLTSFTLEMCEKSGADVQKRGRALIKSLLMAMPIIVTDLEIIDRTLKSLLSKTISSKESITKYINKIGQAAIELLCDVFDAAFFTEKHNHNFFITRNMAPLLSIMQKFMHFSSREHILLIRRLFCAIKKVPLCSALNAFYSSIKNAVVESLQSFIHANELDTAEGKAMNPAVSVEFSLLFLEVFEENFPFCSENPNFVSDLFAKIFANASNCSLATDERWSLRLKLALKFFRSIRDAGFSNFVYVKLSIIIQSSSDPELIAAIFESLREDIENGANIDKVEQIIYNSQSALGLRLRSPAHFQLYLRVLAEFLERHATEKMFGELKALFVAGITASEPGLVSRFFRLIFMFAPKSVFKKLSCFLNVETMRPLRELFWIKHLLLLIIPGHLAGIKNDFKITSYFTISPIESPGLSGNQKCSEVSNGIIKKLLSFSAEETEASAANVADQIKAICFEDEKMAAGVWEELFPFLWGTFSDAQKESVSKSLNEFLGAMWVNKAKGGQDSPASEAMRVLLNSLVSASGGEGPVIDCNLLIYIASQHRAWHEVAALLEKRRDWLCRNRAGSADLETVTDALKRLYELLNEKHAFYGLWSQTCASKHTSMALDLQLFSMWKPALEVSGQLFCLPKEKIEGIAENEQLLWQKIWIDSAKNLGLWDILFEYSRESNNVELQLELSPRLFQWDYLKNMVSIYDMTDNTNIKHRANYDIYLSLIFKYPSVTVQGHFDKAFQTMRDDWRRLPLFVSHSHDAELQNFQRFLELKESHRILKQSNENSILKVKPEVKMYSELWRERLPNKWESQAVWHDLLRWRLAVFFELIKSFSDSKNSDLAQLQDLSWTIAKLSKVAAGKSDLHGAVKAFALYDEKLSGMDPENGFERLYQELKILSRDEKQQESAMGFMNAVDYSEFTNEQVSKLLVLKASAAMTLKQKNEMKEAVQAALTVNPNNHKAWMKWAEFCEPTSTLKYGTKSVESALCCYLSALTVDVARSKEFVPRILWLLNYNKKEASHRKFCELINKFWDGVPLWVWIFWAPTIINSLARSGGEIFEKILSKLAQHYPQAVYAQVRSAVGPKPDERKGAPGKSSKSLFRVMAVFSGAHAVYVAEAERIFETLATRFKPSIEEELYSAVNGILNKCYRLCDTGGDHIPETIKDTTLKILSQFFKRYSDLSNKNKENTGLKEFIKTLQSKFEKDFQHYLSGQNSAKSFAQLINRLRGWKRFLFYAIGQNGEAIFLERLSPALAALEESCVEVFGQYNFYGEPAPRHHRLVAHFAPKVEIVSINGYYSRKLTVVSQWGARHAFLVQLALSHVIKMEERLQQFYVFSNHFFERFPETRQAGLSFAAPRMVPLSSCMRLLELRPGEVSLNDVWEQHCSRRGMDPDDVFARYAALPREKGAGNEGFLADVAREFELEGLLESHFRREHASPESFWAFRKTFAKQFALVSYMEHLFLMNEKFPYKKFVDSRTGHIKCIESYPFYDESLSIKTPAEGHFRLTPEVRRLLSPALLRGVFAPSVVLAATTLLKHCLPWKYFFYLFVLDDITSWAAIKRKPGESESAPLPEEKLKEAIRHNTFQIMKQVMNFVRPEYDDAALAAGALDAEAKHISGAVAAFVDESSDAKTLGKFPIITKPWI